MPWLVKSEPEVYSYDALVAEGQTVWTGVRNAQARNNLVAMRVGDEVVFYHSQTDRAAVGLATVVRESYPDPTSPDDDRWRVVELAPLKKFTTPVSLATIKADPLLRDSALVRQSRLSVMPLREDQLQRIRALGGVL